MTINLKPAKPQRRGSFAQFLMESPLTQARS
jgi:hypothetical protein